MGIRLDWEVEAEQSNVQNSGEDRELARQRRAARLRLLMFLLIVVLLLGGAAGAILWRLDQVDQQITQLLVNTVDAEVAALRIGDRTAFLDLQRSASNDWLVAQEAVFDTYQALKAEMDVRLTGRVIDVEVEDTRGRVQVEEIIAGVPYSQVWFYWRYADGWRHVPPDFTFWGEARTLDRQRVEVRYRAVDQALATVLADDLNRWLNLGCEALPCTRLPQLEVEIVPNDALPLGWSPANPWLVQIPSPLTGRARLDMPFNPDLQVQAANLVAERLVAQATNNLQPVYPSDAVYLHQAVIRWLVGSFTGIETESYFINSLIQNNGAAAVGRLLTTLQPNASISTVNQVTGTSSLEQASLDWRDFIQWRLTLEQDLINQRDQGNFLALYDTGDPNASNLAASRFNANAPREAVVVLAAATEIDANGVPHLRSRVRVGTGETAREQDVILRLVNGVWLRAN